MKCMACLSAYSTIQCDTAILMLMRTWLYPFNINVWLHIISYNHTLLQYAHTSQHPLTCYCRGYWKRGSRPLPHPATDRRQLYERCRCLSCLIDTPWQPERPAEDLTSTQTKYVCVTAQCIRSSGVHHTQASIRPFCFPLSELLSFFTWLTRLSLSLSSPALTVSIS